MPADTIVLIHGAWHGGWCWDRVRPALETAGFAVHAPTLPGLATERWVGATPGLEDHIQAVVDTVEDSSGRVLLVGHSYGGMAVTGAAQRVADRISGLVYLDAAVPADGCSFASWIPGIDAETIGRRESAFRQMAPDDAWLPVPPFEMIGIHAQADKEWLAPRLRPHPLRTWLEPIHLSHAAAPAPRTYVLATDPPTTLMGYPAQGALAQSSPDWTYREIATGHEMMVTEPDATAGMILEAARA